MTANLTTERKAACNKGLPKAGVTSFYDSFVLNQTLVFQMNRSAETPRLRQAPNRYLQPLTSDSATIKRTGKLWTTHRTLQHICKPHKANAQT